LDEGAHDTFVPDESNRDLAEIIGVRLEGGTRIVWSYERILASGDGVTAQALPLNLPTARGVLNGAAF
jgi:hypothetical protein